MERVSSTLACQEGNLRLLYSSQPIPGTLMRPQQGDPLPMQLVATAAMLLLQVCVSRLHVHTYLRIYDLSHVGCVVTSVLAVPYLTCCQRKRCYQACSQHACCHMTGWDVGDFCRQKAAPANQSILSLELIMTYDSQHMTFKRMFTLQP